MSKGAWWWEIRAGKRSETAGRAGTAGNEGSKTRKERKREEEEWLRMRKRREGAGCWIVSMAHWDDQRRRRSCGEGTGRDVSVETQSRVWKYRRTHTHTNLSQLVDGCPDNTPSDSEGKRVKCRLNAS